MKSIVLIIVVVGLVLGKYFYLKYDINNKVNDLFEGHQMIYSTSITNDNVYLYALEKYGFGDYHKTSLSLKAIKNTENENFIHSYDAPNYSMLINEIKKFWENEFNSYHRVDCDRIITCWQENDYFYNQDKFVAEVPNNLTIGRYTVLGNNFSLKSNSTLQKDHLFRDIVIGIAIIILTSILFNLKKFKRLLANK